MSSQAMLTEQDLGADDIGRLVSALLESIRRGELQATEKEVDFLVSVEDMLVTVTIP